MTKQPARAVLASEKTFVWGWGLYEATFPAGTKCKLAVNLPEVNNLQPYWIVGKPSSICKEGQKASMEDFKSWEHNYGFQVDANDVEEMPKVVRKKKR